jgi:hypothetical protein
MNIALAALASLTVSRDEDYINDNENEPKNEDIDENKSVNHDVNRPPAIAE